MGGGVGKVHVGLFAPFVQQYGPLPPLSQQSALFAPFTQQYLPLPPFTQQSGYAESGAPLLHNGAFGGGVGNGSCTSGFG